MSTPREPTKEGAAVPKQHGPAENSTSSLLLEIMVVLALAVAPHIFNAVSYLISPWHSQRPIALATIADLFQAIQESLPLLYIMYLSGKPWSYFGLVRPSARADLLWALVLFIILNVITTALAGGQIPDPSAVLP